MSSGDGGSNAHLEPMLTLRVHGTRDSVPAGSLTEERQLIEGFLRGDPKVFRVVDEWIEVALRENGRSLFPEWEDVKQEVRTRLYRNLAGGSFSGRSTLRTYAHRIAKNVCIDLSRKASLRRRLDPDPTSVAVIVRSPGDPLSGWVAGDLLEKLLDGFPDRDRELLDMVFVEHCSYTEVARRLHIPVGTVKSRMSRCKDRILARRRQLLERGDAP